MAKLQEMGKRPARAASEDLSPEQATRQAVAAVFRDLDLIVKALSDKAKEGSHLHAKLLFDFAGISAAASLLPAEPTAERPSLARLLMDKLEQMAEESGTAEGGRPVE